VANADCPGTTCSPFYLYVTILVNARLHEAGPPFVYPESYPMDCNPASHCNSPLSQYVLQMSHWIGILGAIINLADYSSEQNQQRLDWLHHHQICTNDSGLTALASCVTFSVRYEERNPITWDRGLLAGIKIKREPRSGFNQAYRMDLTLHERRASRCISSAERCN
jgi:hypothetical protein